MNKKLLTLAVALSLGVGQANAIEITSNDNPFNLSDILTGFGVAGITITDASLSYGLSVDGGWEEGWGEGGFELDPDSFEVFSGGDQTGVYSNTSGTYGLPAFGVVLSSGNVNDYGDGPNTSDGNSSNWGSVATLEQNLLLDPVSGAGSVFMDVVQLDIQFDAAPNIDTVSFLGVFGSEEYPDYVGSEFNDGFGLYLNGNNIAGVEPTGGGTPLTVNINHPDMTDVPGTELNGVVAPNGNPLLRFDAAVVPGSTGNTLTVIIADRGDTSLDSTVYLASLGAVGANEFIPVMPSNAEPNPDGSFDFEVIVGETGLGIDTPIWIDPIIAIGYTYEVSNGPNFASVTFPSLAAVNDLTGYELYVWNGADYGFVGLFDAGDTYDFGLLGIDQFQIMGIDIPLELDPNDPNAFVTGLTFVGSGTVDMSMTAVTYDTDAASPSPVPAPSLLLLFLAGGIPMLLMMNRRRVT